MNLPKTLAQHSVDLQMIRKLEEEIRLHRNYADTLAEKRIAQIKTMFPLLTPVIALKTWNAGFSYYPKGIVVGVEENTLKLKVIIEGETAARITSWEDWRPYDPATGGES